MPLMPTPHENSLIPFLGGLISKAAPFLGGFLSRTFGGGAAAPVTRALAPVTRALAPVARRALPVLRQAGRITVAGGAFGAGAELVQRGFKIVIDRKTGQQKVVRIRRMNPTNIRAARRALRRLRGFKRVTRKVNRLLQPPVRFLGHRARRRRGDIVPFEHDGSINEFAAEDWADYADELEDLGFDPGFFQGDAAAEAEE